MAMRTKEQAPKCCPPAEGVSVRLALDPIAALQGDRRARLQAGGGFPLHQDDMSCMMSSLSKSVPKACR